VTAVEDSTTAASEYLMMLNVNFVAQNADSAALDYLIQLSVKSVLAKFLILTDSISTVNINLTSKHYSAACDHHQDSV